MKFEDLEIAWAAQSAVAPVDHDLADVKRTVIPELRRRSRMFVYGLFTAGFGLVVTPLLAIVNYRHARPHDVGLFWVNLAAFLVVYIPVFVYLIQRMRRHRRLRRQSTDTLRALTSVSLANLEAEMQEYRVAGWLAPLLVGLPLMSAYANHPVIAFGWPPFALRAAMIFAVLIPVAWISWRHYRRTLAPEHARQAELLRELS